MSSVFQLPFKVDNQAIWQNHILKFYTIYLVLWLYTTLSFKTGLQVRAIGPPTKSKQLHKGVPFPTAASAYHISVNTAVVKKYRFHDSRYSLIVTLINKIECKYQTRLNFDQIMRSCLCICKDRKVFSS